MEVKERESFRKFRYGTPHLQGSADRAGHMTGVGKTLYGISLTSYSWYIDDICANWCLVFVKFSKF